MAADLLKGIKDTLNFGNVTKGVNYSPVELDPETRQRMNDYITRSSRSPEEMAAEQNAGAQQLGQRAFETPEQIQRQVAGGMTDNSSMLQAIRNKYNKSAQKDISGLMKKNEIDSPLRGAEALKKASEVAMARQNVAMENYSNMVNAYNQSQIARAQVISSLFSAGGTAAGYGFAGKKKNQDGGQPSNNSSYENDGTGRRPYAMAGIGDR
jgi:hypothetical protein